MLLIIIQAKGKKKKKLKSKVIRQKQLDFLFFFLFFISRNSIQLSHYIMVVKVRWQPVGFFWLTDWKLSLIDVWRLKRETKEFDNDALLSQDHNLIC